MGYSPLRSVVDDSLRRIALAKEQPTLYIGKYGRNTSVTAACDIWEGGGFYSGFPTGDPEPISVVSSSASDAASGVGARKVQVVGTGLNYIRQVEEITLNGTTPVVTTSVWTRVNRVYVSSAGSTGYNVGSLTVRHSVTTADIFCVVAAGMGQTQVAALTVPAGYTGLITNFSVGISNGGASAVEAVCGLAVRPYGTGSWRMQQLITASTVGGEASHNWDGGLKVPEKCDIAMRVVSTGGTVSANASFEGFFVPTSYIAGGTAP